MAQDNSTETSARPIRLGWADYLLMAIVSAGLIVYCVKFSRNRLLWPDETYSREFVLTPGIARMVSAWRSGADGGGIFYYLLCRCWIKVFGFTELHLRLFSTSGMIAALLFTWITARRYFSIFAVAVGTSVVFFTSRTFLFQDVDGRFYGMFLATAVLACAVFAHNAEKAQASPVDLALIAGSQALLIGTHALGIVYAASLLLMMLLFDRVCHRWKPRLYLAALAGWIMLPIDYQSIVSNHNVTKAGFWTLKPALRSLPDFVFAAEPTFSSWFFWLIVYIALAGLFIARLRPYAPPLHRLRNNPWIFIVGGLALTQLILFAKSRVGLSLYAERYMMPLQIATVFLIAALVTYAWRLAPWLWPTRRFAVLASALVILFYLKHALATPVDAIDFPTADMPHSFQKLLPANHAVVTASLGTFVVMRVYDPSHDYIYPMDWAFDSDPSHASGGLTSQQTMENWRSGGLAPDDILDCQDIFNRLPDFTLVVEASREPWAHDRILDSPAFRTQQVASFHDPSSAPVTIWDVHRIAPVASCR